MAKMLYLLRHGKSRWAEPGADDAARPLTKRGREAARRMGRELARRARAPEQVLCSTARRTRETLERLCKGFAKEGARPPPVRFEEALYLASADGLLDRIRNLEGDPAAVLLIGHNPGLHELALGLTGGSAGDLQDRLRRAFPTAALAAIEFPIGAWSELAPGRGKLLDLVLPRELG